MSLVTVSVLSVCVHARVEVGRYAPTGHAVPDDLSTQNPTDDAAFAVVSAIP